MRPATSLHENRIGGTQNFRPPVQNDFATVSAPNGRTSMSAKAFPCFSFWTRPHRRRSRSRRRHGIDSVRGAVLRGVGSPHHPAQPRSLSAASLGVSAVAALIILEFDFGLPVALFLFPDPAFGLLAAFLILLLRYFPPASGVAAGVRWHRSKR